jgi:hypothetical protein
MPEPLCGSGETQIISSIFEALRIASEASPGSYGHISYQRVKRQAAATEIGWTSSCTGLNALARVWTHNLIQ